MTMSRIMNSITQKQKVEQIEWQNDLLKIQL